MRSGLENQTSDTRLARRTNRPEYIPIPEQVNPTAASPGDAKTAVFE